MLVTNSIAYLILSFFIVILRLVFLLLTLLLYGITCLDRSPFVIFKVRDSNHRPNIA